MNWVLIIVVLLLVWEMMRGYQRGLLRTIYSLVSWIVVLVFVMWATPYINNYLLEHTPLYEMIEAHCADEVRRSVENSTEKTRVETTRQEDLSELGIQLPDSVLNDILEKTGDMADEFLENSGIYAQVASGVAGFIVQGISFFIALIIAWVLVYTISKFLGIVSRIPVIRGVNKTLGILAGGIYGLILIWIAFYMAALSSTSELGSIVISYIYQNPLLQMLYENNLVITMLLVK